MEVLAVLAGYQIYEWTRGASPSHPGLAHRNGRAIWRGEQWAHLNPERALNHAVEAVPPLAALSGYYYLALNITVPMGLLVWLYVKRAAAYGRLRWMLAAMTAMSLVCFWGLPVSPPRFVVSGMIDTVATSHLIGAAYENDIAPHANLYAAMPSLHIAWAGWCTLAVVTTCRRRWVHAVFWAYPVVTTLDILVTANHYLADALGGVVVLAAGWAIVVLTARLWRGPPVQKPVSIRKH